MLKLFKSQNFKRLRALFITLILGFLMNGAISIAIGDDQKTASTYTYPKPKDLPHPKDVPVIKTASTYTIPNPKDLPKP